MAIDSLLNPQERLDWLRLIRTENVGPVTFHHLLQRYGSAAAALAALPDLARRGGRQNLKPASRAEAERELAAVEAAGARLVAWGEPDYPPLLAALEDAPPLLTIKGALHLARRPSVIAIVGARNASAAGLRFARELAWDLGRAGLLVASGLARGIDAAAHGGALDSGTLAVLAGGVDVIYPDENSALYHQIAERGLLVAEMPVGTIPQARHFPRRNRLISGVAKGVVVIEAALKSGSLITARFAADQGREVFAVPGSPIDPRCRGANDLIRHGATLIESAEDVLAVLGRGAQPDLLTEHRRRQFAAQAAAAVDEGAVAATRGRLLDLLGPTPVTVDELIRASGASPAVILTLLLELELAGRLDRHPGDQVSLR